MNPKQASLKHLLSTYDKPLPRYTSYPTVPFWKPETMHSQIWSESLSMQFDTSKRKLALYIHLPFCENLCTFCGCNKRITKNHKVEEPYIDTLIKEWQLYLKLWPEKPIIEEIHLGGGTPTFFAPKELNRLLSAILDSSQVAENYEFSVEVHPNATREEHLKTLAELGFKRISIGIQDFDEKVQYIINRNQTFEQTERVFQWAHKYGFTGFNVDLVYGLPLQTKESIKMTVELIALLKPHRIAYYSYAHVPWKSKAQRRYTEADLPPAADKLEMYLLGKELLSEQGFIPIGMDHFALPNDALFKAKKQGKLHRNFMGYTTNLAELNIGLGASAIGATQSAFMQNIKEVEDYQAVVNQGEFPIHTGHLLTVQEQKVKQFILDLMCNCKLHFNATDFEDKHYQAIVNRLPELQAEGLIILDHNHLTLTEVGEIFSRVVASVFDENLFGSGSREGMFSKAV